MPYYPFSFDFASSEVGWHLPLIGQPEQPQPQEELLPLRFERTIPNIMRATNATTHKSTAILPIVSPIFRPPFFTLSNYAKKNFSLLYFLDAEIMFLFGFIIIYRKNAIIMNATADVNIS